MVYVPVQCPYCQSTEVIRAGTQANGTQRYRCKNTLCERQIVLLRYQDRGRLPEVRRQVVDRAINGSGLRDTALVLWISPTTVMPCEKKSPLFNPSTPCYYNLLVRATALSASRHDAPPSSMSGSVPQL